MWMLLKSVIFVLKGLIIENAQGWQTVNLLYIDKHQAGLQNPSHKKGLWQKSTWKIINL